MDNLGEFEEDFGFSTVDINDVKSVTEIQSRITELEQRIETVRGMILPLIHNLMKDPHKDIHWPDRDVKLADFEKRLTNALDGTVDPVAEPSRKKKRVRTNDA